MRPLEYGIVTVTGHLETFEKGCLTDFVNVLNERHCDNKTHKAMRVVSVHCSLSQRFHKGTTKVHNSSQTPFK